MKALTIKVKAVIGGALIIALSTLIAVVVTDGGKGVEVSEDDTVLQYVFEVVRHGARSPVMSFDEGKFTV